MPTANSPASKASKPLVAGLKPHFRHLTEGVSAISTGPFFLTWESHLHIFITVTLLISQVKGAFKMKDYFSPNISDQSRSGASGESNALCRSGSDADACISGSGCVGCNSGSDVSNCVQG